MAHVFPGWSGPDFLGLEQHNSGVFHSSKQKQVEMESKKSFNQGIQFHAVHKHRLSIFYVLDIVQGTRDTGWIKYG